MDINQTNEIAINIATINGSGSATANNTLLKSIFKMGIPVSGRNSFPSNIQGMPSWYSLRVSGKGYLGRTEKDHILISMNRETTDKDITRLIDGGILLKDRDIEWNGKQEQVRVIDFPSNEILEQCDVPKNLRVYLANMVYVGVIAQILQIWTQKIEETLNQHFKNRIKAVNANLKVIRAAADWSKKNIPDTLIHPLESMSKTTDSSIMIDGNSAAALGSLFGGLQFSAWYPITPATSIAETLNAYIPKLRLNTDDRTTTCVVLQAEDELAAVGMAVGAGWAGLRSMTMTSGPGLSLMTEFLGLAYFSEVPLVVWDVQRVGPSTGMPTRTSQSDLSFAYFMGHGDTDFIILIPANIEECFEFAWKALDIAEELQTPVIVLSDLELGMNSWISEEFQYPDTPIKRGKVLWEKDIQNLIENGKKWGRYLDIDKDGIPYRTIPGNLHKNASYFARGTGHDEFAHYSEDPEIWRENLDRLKRKIVTHTEIFPEPIILEKANAKIGIIAYGTTDMAVKEVIDCLEAEEDIAVDYFRVRSLPFGTSLEQFIRGHEMIFCAECNRDGQMLQIIRSQFPNNCKQIISIAISNGLSISAEQIIDHVKTKIKKFGGLDEYTQ